MKEVKKEFDIFSGFEKYKLKNDEKIAELKKTILTNSKWCNTEELLKLNTMLTLEKIKKWETDKKIFSILNNNEKLYPLYIFNESLEPIQSVSAVLKIFSDEKKPWSIVFWFESINSWLNNRKPKDVLFEDENLVFAAKIEVEGIQHG